MSNFPVIQDEPHETPEARRKRLAIEFRSITNQFNSKLLEMMDADLRVDVSFEDVDLVGHDALIGRSDISFQTKPKHY